MTKEPNVYSFADECYVYYGDYKKDLEQKDKEIERLNNIMNELEDMIVIKLQRDYHEHDYRINTGDLEDILDKLKKLKEGK